MEDQKYKLIKGIWNDWKRYSSTKESKILNLIALKIELKNQLNVQINSLCAIFIYVIIWLSNQVRALSTSKSRT